MYRENANKAAVEKDAQKRGELEKNSKKAKDVGAKKITCKTRKDGKSFFKSLCWRWKAT